MADTPRASVPTLRGFLGALSSRKTAAVTTYRALYKLFGGLTQNDIDVEDVINALVDRVDAMPVEVVKRGKASIGVQDMVSYVTTTAGVETAWELDVSGLAGQPNAKCYQFEADICAISDDGLDFATYKIVYSVSWDGSGVAQLAAPGNPVTPPETSPASSSATMDVSGTKVRLRVGGVADWRYGGYIRVTKMEF